MATASIRGSVIVLDPTSPGAVSTGSVFLDNTNNNALTTKTVGGVTTQVGAANSQDIMVKTMQNISGATIPAGKPVSKRGDGSIVIADSDAVDGQRYVGIALDTIATSSTGRVLLVGPNVASAILGLGFLPGQDIFIAEHGAGYTNDPTTFTSAGDSIIKVGIADCPPGIANGIATDLIMFSDVLARP